MIYTEERRGEERIREEKRGEEKREKRREESRGEKTLFMNEDFPTFGYPVRSRVRVLGSKAGKREICFRTSSRYPRAAFSFFSTVIIRP